MKWMVGTINVTSLVIALHKFESFRQNLSSEELKAGAIQAFEYSYDLSWKTMKRLLMERGRTTYSLKEVFRLAAQEGWIRDPEVWFDFIQKRSAATHCCNTQNTMEVIEAFPLFSRELDFFVKSIGIDGDKIEI